MVVYTVRWLLIDGTTGTKMFHGDIKSAVEFLAVKAGEFHQTMVSIVLRCPQRQAKGQS